MDGSSNHLHDVTINYKFSTLSHLLQCISTHTIQISFFPQKLTFFVDFDLKRIKKAFHILPKRVFIPIVINH